MKAKRTKSKLSAVIEVLAFLGTVDKMTNWRDDKVQRFSIISNLVSGGAH
jgi:hypothetical protein